MFRFIDTSDVCCRSCNLFAIFVKFLNICKLMGGRLCCRWNNFGMIVFGGYRRGKEKMSG